MNAAVIRGVVGQIKWHHYPAAAIHDYTVTRKADKSGWTVRGVVVLSDAFKLTQRPLTFVAPFKKQGSDVAYAWRWPILSHSIDNGRLTASLGAPEK